MLTTRRAAEADGLHPGKGEARRDYSQVYVRVGATREGKIHEPVGEGREDERREVIRFGSALT